MPKKLVTTLTIGGVLAAAAFFFKRALLKWVLIGTGIAAAFVWWKSR